MSDSSTETAQSTNNADSGKSQADVLFGKPADKAAEAPTSAEATQQADGKTAEAQADGKAAEQVVETAKSEVKVGDLKIPKDSMLDQGRVTKIADFAKLHNLTNEQAQSMVDMQHETLQAFQESQVQMMHDKKIEWAESAKADKELGGEHFVKNIEIAKRGLDQTASPALKKMLDDTGLGNHPEVIKHFLKIGKQSENGTFHPSGAASNTNKKSPADILFG